MCTSSWAPLSEHFSVQDKRDLAHSSPVTNGSQNTTVGQSLFHSSDQNRGNRTQAERGGMSKVPQADMWLRTFSRGA